MKRKLEREKQARKDAERLLEEKALQLYFANEKLRELNTGLEKQLALKSSALKTHQDRYQGLVENAEDIIFWITPDGFFTQINPIAARIFDKEISTLVGSHYLELVHPDYLERVQGMYQRQIERRIPTTYLEFPVIGPNGQSIWLGQRITLIFKEGKLVELAGLARNITHRVNAEQKLSLLNTRFKALLENMQAGILVEDENQKVILANQKFSEIFDIFLNYNNLTNKNAHELMRAIEGQWLEKGALTELINPDSPQKEVIQKELRLNTGQILLLNFIPIYQDQKWLGKLWYFEDITDRKNSEIRIRRSEEKYRGIMENMELGLLEVDKAGMVTRAYQRFCAMSGYTEEELLNQDATQLLLPVEYQEMMERQNKTRKSGQPGVYEVELITKGGKRKWVLISGAPFYDESGDFIGSIGIHYDLTEFKKLQYELEEARHEAENARDAEKDFLANMSHEVRNPINTIVGMTYLLLDTELTAEQRRYLQNIKYTSDILLALVSDILDITKITQGKMELELRELNLGELINVNAQAMAFRIKEKGIHFDIYVDRLLNTRVMGDSTFLNQILLNILGNAAKFTEKGSISIHAQCLNKTKDTLRAKIIITDTGIGIADDKLPLIFERFNQAGKATKHKYGGTGLGLNIAKKLVELHNAELNVQSTEGKGTVFSFEIDFNLVHRSETGLSQTAGPKIASRLHALNVLVVEDNVLNQEYIERVLERLHIRFRTANNGKEALKILETDRFDLILMDIRMPEMDGYETTIRLRNMHHNPNSQVPIVALTASALLDEKEKALNTGMNYHLTKPFTPDQIEKVIAQAMENRVEPLVVPPDVHTLWHPELNAEEIEEMFAGDVEHFQVIIGIFNRTIPEDFATLELAMKERDWESARGLAHKLKPSFQMVGLGYMTSNIQDFEQALELGTDQVLIQQLFYVFAQNVHKALHITVQQEDYFRQTI
ncbi:PAS domain S-box protein [Haliscomenobacter sp.]|uniref:PAS domain S-box protein n=1 Tax=Haliscomenobacter sp. TaxID=2717303 RepID=UPI0035946789